MLGFVRRNDHVRKMKDLYRAYAQILSFITARLRQGCYSERRPSPKTSTGGDSGISMVEPKNAAVPLITVSQTADNNNFLHLPQQQSPRANHRLSIDDQPGSSRSRSLSDASMWSGDSLPGASNSSL